MAILTYKTIFAPPDLELKLTVAFRDGTTPSTMTLPITDESDTDYRIVSAPLVLNSAAVSKITVTLTNRTPQQKAKIHIDSVEVWWLPLP
jgi:hypothetical protein